MSWVLRLFPNTLGSAGTDPAASYKDVDPELRPSGHGLGISSPVVTMNIYLATFFKPCFYDHLFRLRGALGGVGDLAPGPWTGPGHGSPQQRGDSWLGNSSPRHPPQQTSLVRA